MFTRGGDFYKQVIYTTFVSDFKLVFNEEEKEEEKEKEEVIKSVKFRFYFLFGLIWNGKKM